MSAAAHRPGERGAALLVAVLLTAVLAVVAGTIALFALIEVRTAAAAREEAQASCAVHTALELAAAALAAEPDLAAVRRGLAVAPAVGADRLATADGPIDVAVLTRRLQARRARLPPPGDTALWRPYLWGRLGELMAIAPGPRRDDPLVVVWVRGDDTAGLEPDRIELAAVAVTPDASQASATAIARRGPRGVAIGAVWPDGSVAGAP